MCPMYHISWKEVNDFKVKMVRERMIILIIIALVTNAGVYGFILMGLKWLLYRLIVIDIIFILLAVVHLYIYHAWKKYSFVERLNIYKDRLVYTTATNNKFVAYFKDFGLIVSFEGQMCKRYGKFYLFPWMLIVYYNNKYAKCFEIYVDKEVGKKIIKAYEEYSKEKNLKMCPILTGIEESSSETNIPIEKLKKSAFCRRR